MLASCNRINGLRQVSLGFCDPLKRVAKCEQVRGSVRPIAALFQQGQGVFLKPLKAGAAA